MCPAYNDNLTKSTKEIPSGKQIEDILEAIVLAAWNNKEKTRVENLIKKRNQSAQKKSESKGYKTASTEIQPMPAHWLDPRMVPWFLYGDLSDDQEPFFVSKQMVNPTKITPLIFLILPMWTKI